MADYGGSRRRRGVKTYEIGPNSIDVEFASGWIYHFTYERTGPLRVEQMKELAESGQGLSSFINKHARNRFASRRRKES